MKPSLRIYTITIAMVFSVMLGSRIVPGVEKSPFELAHAGLTLPFFDDFDMECSHGLRTPEKLMNPSKQKLNDYELNLFDFVINRKYATGDYSWCRDKKVRGTGPFLQGVSYNFHGAARIYYSPRMMYWLTGNPEYMGNNSAYPAKSPRSGPVLDGAMIIKEGFAPPADLYDQIKSITDTLYKYKPKSLKREREELYEEILSSQIWGWSIMVKDSEGSKDGWFWSSASPPAYGANKKEIAKQVENSLSDYNIMAGMNSDFNLPCTRCHASAEKQFTFSDLTNIAGVTPEDQRAANVLGNNILHFQNDVSWKDTTYLNANMHLKIDDLAKLMDSLYKSGNGKDSLIREALITQLHLPKWLRPWTRDSIPGFSKYMLHHLLDAENGTDKNLGSPDPLNFINPAFVDNYNIESGLDSVRNILKKVTYNSVQKFPFQWADHVVPEPQNVDHYITSDNCMGCHGGLGYSPYDISMFVRTGPKDASGKNGYNISEYGEWRWSPMGLAGRDPIFFSQLESEMALLEHDAHVDSTNHYGPKRLFGSLDSNKMEVRNTCLSCHGSMGERQLKKDAAKDKTLNPDFKVEYMFLTEAISQKVYNHNTKHIPNYEEDYKYHKYGNLGREGISCATCHHISSASPETVKAWNPKKSSWLTSTVDTSLAYFLFHNNTGRYVESPANELNGPFNDVITNPMQNALGITPMHNEFTSNSQMCGTCHTINLPNIGMPKDDAKFAALTASETNPLLSNYGHSIEQATFLEWQNSAFGFKVDGKTQGDDFMSCQGCHMPNSFESFDGKVKIDQITTKIATIQDFDYAFPSNQLPNDSLVVKPRSDYKRHELVGLNVFLLEMFNQFPRILGANKQDYMTGATNGTDQAIENMLINARDKTVDIDVDSIHIEKDSLKFNVKVTNKVGHRFPSGVAFRRAFLEVLVIDTSEYNKPVVIWGSGRTNAAGVIVDQYNIPLKTEFLPDKKTYQHHHQMINRQDQVQIYEELNLSQDSSFTTSFIHRNRNVKDNRLIPRGWRSSDNFKKQGKIMKEFMEATDPHGVVGDPDYIDPYPTSFAGADNIKYHVSIPSGTDRTKLSVKVTMYYQAIPPFWLQQRFKLAPSGEATKRLYYMTSHLDLDDTPMKDWKLPVGNIATTSVCDTPDCMD